MSLCTNIQPPPIDLIREFYSNLTVSKDVCNGYYLTSWIHGVMVTINRDVVPMLLTYRGFVDLLIHTLSLLVLMMLWMFFVEDQLLEVLTQVLAQVS